MSCKIQAIVKLKNGKLQLSVREAIIKLWPDLSDYVRFEDLAPYVKFDDLRDYAKLSDLNDYVSKFDVSVTPDANTIAKRNSTGVLLSATAESGLSSSNKSVVNVDYLVHLPEKYTFSAHEKDKWDEMLGLVDNLEPTTIAFEFTDDMSKVITLTNDTLIGIKAVDWYGDGSVIEYFDSTVGINTISNTYPAAGEYTCKIYGVTEIGTSAFLSNLAIKQVELSNDVKKIDIQSFRGCSNLLSIKLSDNLQTIGRNSFYLCQKLTDIVIPASVTSIELQAFYRCESLKTVEFKSDIPLTYDSSWFTRANNLEKILVPNSAYETYKSEWSTVSSKIDSIAFRSDIIVPTEMKFVYREIAANTRYEIKRNGYYMVYSNTANLTLAKADGTVVVDGAKQLQFMTPPIEGGTNIKACGIYWTGSALGGVEGFRRTTNDGGYVTANTEFYISEMIKE